MKKILAFLLVVVAMVGLVACNEEVQVTVKSLSVSGQDTEFVVGDVFDKGELKVVATLSDGTEVDVTDKIKVEQNVNMEVPGSYAVLISYEGLVAYYQVNVNAKAEEAKLVSISVAGGKTEFTVGDTFETTGLVVTAKYSDGSSKDVTDKATVTQNADMAVNGKYAVYVAFEGQNAVYEIKVNAKPEPAYVTSIEIAGAKAEFNVGDTFETTGLVVTAKYSDGTSKDVTSAATISQNVDMAVNGKYAVLVSYEGFVASYVVEVKALENVKTLTDISVSSDEAKKLYELGETVSLENVVVYEYYSNTVVSDSIEKVTDLSNYTVKVLDSEGNEVSGEFTKYGYYTVFVSNGELTDSYEVRVGAYLYESVEEALNTGLENYEKVNSGYITVNNNDSITEYEYLFGDNYTKVVEGTYTYHYELTGEETIFGASEYYDEWEDKLVVGPTYEPAVENMLGANLSSLLSYNYEIYGVEGLISLLSEIGLSEEAMNYKDGFSQYCEICGLHKAYNYSFELVLSDYYYYFINVEFTLNVEQVIEEFNVTMNGYYLENMDLNAETGVYTVKEGVLGYDFNSKVEGKQFVGERSEKNPFSAAEVMFTAFDLKLNDEIVSEGQEIAVGVQESVELTLTNVTPVTANGNLDEIKVYVTDEFGLETWSAFGSYDDGVVTVTSYKIGTFNVEVYSTNVSKKFVLNVSYGDTTSFEAGIYNYDTWEMEPATEASVYVGMDLEFGPIVNENGNPEFTAELKEVDETVSITVMGTSAYFNAQNPGVYTVVLTSVANPELTAELVVTVLEAPEAKDILNGEYVLETGMMGTVTVVFTPEAEGAVKGTVVISAKGGYVEEEGTFTYEYAYGWLQLTPASEDQVCSFGVDYQFDYTLALTYNGFMQGVLTRPNAGGEEDPEEETIAGYYYAVYTHPMTGMENEMFLLLEDDGTGVYSFMNELYAGIFDYTADGSSLEFTGFFSVTEFAVTEISAMCFDGLIYATIYTEDGGMFTVEFNKIAIEEPENEIVLGENIVSASFDGIEYVFIAEEDGEYTFSTIEGEGLLGYGYAVNTYEVVTLYAGETYVINVCTFEYTDEILNVTVNVTFNKIESEDNGIVGTYSASYTHPMNGMEFPLILALNADGTGSYDFMNGLYAGIFDYTADGSSLEFTGFFSVTEYPVTEISAMCFDGIIYATIYTEDGGIFTVEFSK